MVEALSRHSHDPWPILTGCLQAAAATGALQARLGRPGKPEMRLKYIEKVIVLS